MLRPLVADRFLNDERYRNGHVRIINAQPGVRIMGLHIPDMKMVAKRLAGREDAPEFADKFWKEAGRQSEGGVQPLYYEEKVIWGFLINALKVNPEERFRLLEAFVPHIDNWAVCDTFCCSAKWVDVPGKTARKGKLPFWKCSREELWDFLKPYFGSDREFEVRFAVIMSMCCLLDREWLPEIFAKFDALDFNGIHSEYVSSRSPYYVRMGVAWFLATALAKFPDETRKYVAVSRLPEDVIKLYVRKARESFRTRDVSPF